MSDVEPVAAVPLPDAPSGRSNVGAAAVRGTASLFVRQAINFGVVALGTIALSRLLTPRDFGLYALSLFVINLFTVFGDVGLGAALVRQEADIDESQLASVYSAQQVLVLITFFLTYVSAPWIAGFYGMGDEATWIFRAMAISLLLSVYRMIPALLLERELQFDRLALAEVTEVTVFYGTTLTAAWWGLGPWSFVCGVLARSLSGIALLTVQRPWRPRFSAGREHLASLFRFGAAFQGVTIVSFVKDSITPLAIGKIAGPEAVGLVNWAANLANYPLLFVKVYGRVAFPMFARLQKSPEELSLALDKVIRYNNLLVLGPLALMLALGPEAIALVLTEKWMPALATMNCFLVSNFWVPTVWPMMSALNALGIATFNLRYAVVWMAGTWLFGFPLIALHGIVGYGVANLLLIPSQMFFVHQARRHLTFHVVSSAAPVALAAAVSGGAVWLAKQQFPPGSVGALALMAALGAALYAGLIAGFWRRELASDAAAAWRHLRDRSAARGR